MMDILGYIIGIYLGIGMVFIGILSVLSYVKPETFGTAKEFEEANVFVKTGWIVLSVLCWPYIIWIWIT